MTGPPSASEIAHSGLDILNPLPPAKLDLILDACDLGAGARALDVGCGKGELLKRIHRRNGAAGLGVDISPEYIEAAREDAPAALEFRAGQALSVVESGFDLAACIGAMHALDSHPRRWLRDRVVPGGYVLFGDGYWQREPHPDYLTALGAAPGELDDYATLVASGEPHGLTPVCVVTASRDDWDAYSWKLIANCERDGSPDCRAYAARERARLLAPGGRDTLGFALIAFRWEE